jgi:hypothetical protein
MDRKEKKERKKKDREERWKRRTPQSEKKGTPSSEEGRKRKGRVEMRCEVVEMSSLLPFPSACFPY